VTPRSQNRDKYATALIEAALYVAGRPVDTKTLRSIIGNRLKRKARELATS
jgi:chromosome segregation and condensation protein ScpB